MQLTSLLYSPTGATRKVVRAFAEGFGGTYTENDITLPKDREKPLADSGEGLFVLAGPVYGGRCFKMLTGAAAKLSGQGRPVVLIVTYGGRHYDRALADLYEAASEAGFQTVSCGAFIGEHSFSAKIQTGRPKEDDLQRAREYGAEVRRRLEEGSLTPMAAEAIPQREVDVAAIGSHRKHLSSLTPNRPIPTDACRHCGTCAAACPLGLIDPADSNKIEERCIKCNACVKACPAGAMQFPQEGFKATAENCEQTFGTRPCSPEVWFA